MKLNKIIIAGGGTGGHIFPAIAVANALKRVLPSIDVLFVGAKGKMEMEKVPQAGYSIQGLDIAGFNRKSIFNNWKLPFKLIQSFLQVSRIFNQFKPDAVFGVGGYSSYPVLRFAQWKAIPTFLHEANSFAGKSNILLAKKAKLVMTGTDGMDAFFIHGNVIKTGNPIRSEIAEMNVSRELALEYFGMSGNTPILLVMGGSLGARSINNAINNGINKIIESGVQLIWQTGKGNLSLIPQTLRNKKGLCVTEFISKMDYAYAIADVVVSRAGAIALAEICATGKPSVLVPFPLAAEDHQTVNAMHLVDHGAAVLVKDQDAETKLVEQVIELIKDRERCREFSKAAKSLEVKHADDLIAQHIIKGVEKKYA